MPLDPSFRITRTDAGNAELTKPTNGLSIGQRKILSFLDTPQAIGPLLLSRDLEPEKFERDLAKLRALGLVEVPGMPPEPPNTVTRPGSRAASVRGSRTASDPVTAGPGPVAAASPGTTFAGTPASSSVGTPVVLGSGSSAASPRLWILGLALVAAGALAYITFAGSSSEHATVAATPPTEGTALPPTSNPAAPSAAALAAPPEVSSAATPTPAAPPDVVHPVAATVLDGSNPSNAARKPEAVADNRSSAPDSKPPALATAAPAAPLATAPAISPAKPPPEAAPAVLALPAQAATVPAAAPTAAASRLGTANEAVVALPVANTTPAQPPVQLAMVVPDGSIAHPPAATARPALMDLTPISREQPGFPREAIAAGVNRGTVKARLTVDASGKVSAVTIVDAQPRRVFDRAVSQALAQWTFNPGAASRTTEVEISFDRDRD